MNWRLIGVLALVVGLGKGAVSLFGVKSAVVGWAILLGAGLTCAIVLVLKAPARYFLHGFWTGFFSQVIETLLAAVFAGTYMTNNPDFATLVSQFPMSVNPRALLVVLAPLAGGFNGLLLGVFTWVVSKILGPDKPAATPAPPAEPPTVPPSV